MEKLRLEDIKGIRVTIMGLGLHGGGLASAKFFAENGAKLTVTDLKDEKALSASIQALKDYDINYTLGSHKESDFLNADLVIKNPAVRPDNPYLGMAKWIETDISVFLALCPSTIAAISGSKGKSSCAAALSHILSFSGVKNFIGGNITISPLSFLPMLTPEHIVVLELSSWQLGDLGHRKLLKPKTAILTRIVPDHQDRYLNMDAYVADKRLIYANQDETCFTICDLDDPYGLSFAKETKAMVLGYAKTLPPGFWGINIADSDCPSQAKLPDLGPMELLPAKLGVAGEHARRNMAAASLAAWTLGATPDLIPMAAGNFKGLEHRLELVTDCNGVKWYNDSAATVPEALKAAMDSFKEPVVLITGGSDKALDFAVASDAYTKAEQIILLEGSGTNKVIKLLEALGRTYNGPYADMESAVEKAAKYALPGQVVLMSPACTSFGMFANEFERGRAFKTAVLNLVVDKT
ncbi:UDP-N-acetylmuramoyl-L-alanine--D-glutamate ligase [Spirochaetota bacterium]